MRRCELRTTSKESKNMHKYILTKIHTLQEQHFTYKKNYACTHSWIDYSQETCLGQHVTAILFTQQFMQDGEVRSLHTIRCEAICGCKHCHVHSIEAYTRTYVVHINTFCTEHRHRGSSDTMKALVALLGFITASLQSGRRG